VRTNLNVTIDENSWLCGGVLTIQLRGRGFKQSNPTRLKTPLPSSNPLPGGQKKGEQQS